MRQGNVGCGRELCCCDGIWNFRFLKAPGARHLHTYFAQVGPRPLKLFQRGGGGGGAFRPQRLGALVRSNFNSKIIIFLMIFLSFRLGGGGGGGACRTMPGAFFKLGPGKVLPFYPPSRRPWLAVR